MARPGMWEGINQGMQNAMQTYSMRQQMEQNKLAREIKMFQMFTNFEQGYAKLVDSNANQTTLRNYRQLGADFLTKMGFSVPKDYLNITDPKKLAETNSQIVIGKTTDAIIAWKNNLDDPQKEAEARKSVSMMQSQTKYKLNVQPYITQLASIQQKKELLNKREADKAKLEEQRKYAEKQKGKEEPYKIGHIKEIKVGDKYVNMRYLGNAQWERIGEAPRYKPGVTIKNIMKEETHETKMGITVGNIMLKLKQGGKDAYEAHGSIYNNINKKNEIVYWNTKGLDKTEFLKLPKKAIEAKWTAKKIQTFATRNGMTVEEVLKELRLI